MGNNRLNQQFSFCLEADKEKFIGRQTYLSDGIRKENDAEHAWHMAVMALVLGEYSNDKIGKISRKNSVFFGRNLKQLKRLRPRLHVQWITYSLFC